MTESVTLTEAAERLGVHYMTAYRYVRTGRLVAEKNGGQWVVDVAELERFNDPEQQDRTRSRVLPKQLEARLLAGDENGAIQLVEGAMGSGAGAEEIYLDLLAPALQHIGERWAAGEVSIADEHLATATSMRVIGRIGPRLAKRGRTRGVVLVAGVSDDHHTMPTALLRDLLRAHGFEVQDLGANTPAESIIDRAQSITDLIAVGIAATRTGNEANIRATIGELERALDVPIVLGGAAIESEAHGLSLGSCIPTMSARHALEVFEDIVLPATND
ncbi:MAG: B12-binding domain-containing protein [Acidimicrobiales bacterium]